MEYCKLQLGCLVILLYVAFIYMKKIYYSKESLRDVFFDELLVLCIVTVSLDLITAYTVNHLDVNYTLNLGLHGLFLISLNATIFIMFWYMMYITGALPRKNIGRVIIASPFLFNTLIVIIKIEELEFIKGTYTNYSMGIPAYTCFAMVGLYIILSFIVLLRGWKHIAINKRVSILTYMIVLSMVTAIQIVYPETLITSIAVTVLVIGIYMNQEDPALKELSNYHSETVMSFANLIESRDDSTGGHIKRTGKYVELIVEELLNCKYYQEILTSDYIENLLKAAPMHDIGKISIPDAILQKPGKLTDEEYKIMKSHAEKGGRIIKETFKYLGSEEYNSIAYDVARHHHEKWNGRGYPDGLKEEDIPLCARIMAVADVFDAVSQKRCYRDEMPLDECFKIIEKGRGTDFEPLLVDIFISLRAKVEKIHDEFVS